MKLAAAAGLTAAATLGGCASQKKATTSEEATDAASLNSAPCAAPSDAAPYDGALPAHAPIGRGVGACPGRVAWAHDPLAVAWDGSGFWWEPSHYDEERVLALVRTAVASAGGAEDAATGWAALLEAHNTARIGADRTGTVGYAVGQRIAIKCNMNGSGAMDHSTTGETPLSYTNPVLLRALLVSLVKDAGVPADCITAYDISRIFPDYFAEYCARDITEGVHFEGRTEVRPDESSAIVWSHEFGGPACYLPLCVTEADYLINLASLKGHSYGITLCGKNHFGSFFNGDTFRPPQTAGLHQFVSGPEQGRYSPLVDFIADPRLGGKTVLYLLDGLVCAVSEGSSVTRESALWQQSPFDGGFTASVLASQDPVAIDSVGADLLTNEPAVVSHNAAAGRTGVEGYLHEAAQPASAPSGTSYGAAAGWPVENLGVHEHWNNNAEKLYSRNRGAEEGIELVYLPL